MSIQEWAGAQRLTLALVFTDIVGSTRLANRMGDEQWIQVVIRHAEQGRMLMYGFDCCEIKMIGDAFMVAFRTVDDALDFALAFQADTGDPAIKIRAGIHVGSVYLVDDDLYGKTVNYASRVVSAPPLDWIILSDSAKSDLDIARARSKHAVLIRPTDLGSNLKGFVGPNRLWRALTQEIDGVEKAKAKVLTQNNSPTQARPVLKLPSVPRVESQPPLMPSRGTPNKLRDLMSGAVTRSQPEEQPDWWKHLTEGRVSPNKAGGFLAAFLQGDSERDKKD